MTDLFKEALRNFIEFSDADNISFAPTSGGVNNVVHYVKYDSETAYVLRIYNNGNDNSKVIYEHSVLEQLALKSFSFLLPETIPSILEKKPFVCLSTGASACLFKLIPGTLPKLTCVREIGRVSGELNYAMSQIDLQKIPQKSPNPPYYDLYRVHHAVTRSNFFDKMQSDEFNEWRTEADFVINEIKEIEDKVVAYRESAVSLPISLIHGDLHYDNVLCEGGRVTGLLDFEFCALDWNAMELAICLSKYAGESDPMTYFDLFLSGFAEKGVLTADEILVIPALIILRILSNVIYFVGRAIAGEDSLKTLTDRIVTYCKRITWLKSNSTPIISLIKSKYSI